MGNNNKQELMRTIMEYDFAIYDLALYLDTHPEDAESIATFLKLKDICKKHYDEYIHMYSCGYLERFCWWLFLLCLLHSLFLQ